MRIGYDVHDHRTEDGDGTSAEPPRDPRDTATDCPEVPEEWDR